ncbi:unnamed protein product, partial [Urochloa humidicola]
KTMRLGDERIREARAQQLRRDYEAIAFGDGESVEDFALRLQGMVSQLAVLGDTIEEKEAVTKYLRVVPEKYEQVAISIETLLDLKALSIEEVTGRLKTVEDRASRRAGRVTAGGNLLLTHEEWTARMRPQSGQSPGHRGSGNGGSGGGGGCSGGGKSSGKAPKKGAKPKIGRDQCRRCGKTGHWARECPIRKKPAKSAKQAGGRR